MARRRTLFSAGTLVLSMGMLASGCDRDADSEPIATTENVADEPAHFFDESEPVLVADSVRRVTQSGRWSEDEPDGLRVGWASVLSEREPERLVGTPLSLERVKVRRTQDRTAWVETALAPVFVVAQDETEQLQGQWVDVLGSVRRAPAPSVAQARWELEPRMVQGLEQVDFYLDASVMEASRNPPVGDPSAVTAPTASPAVD